MLAFFTAGVDALGAPKRLPHTCPRDDKALKVRGGALSVSPAAAELIATVVPTLGVVVSNALYFSPLPAARTRVLAASKAGQLGGINPLPTTLMVLNTIAWIIYGLSVQNPYIVASNLPGVVASLTAYTSMLPLMQGHPSLFQAQAVLSSGIFAMVGLWTYLIFSGATAATRTFIHGLFSSSLCIVLFASPLSTISTVIATRSSASIMATTTLMQSLNCFLWTTYGFVATKDIYVWGPNLTGFILGLSQLALKVLFPTK